jgi:hypothetical protein
LNLKTRYEEIEDIASYFHTLPPSAKNFMHSFVEEYVNANFKHKGKPIYTEVDDKRAIYNRNNARNRDILTRSKASGQYIAIDDPNTQKDALEGSIMKNEDIESGMINNLEFFINETAESPEDVMTGDVDKKSVKESFELKQTSEGTKKKQVIIRKAR